MNEYKDIVEKLITTLLRCGPFTAGSDERWLDGVIASIRDKEMLSVIDELVTQFADSPQSMQQQEERQSMLTFPETKPFKE